MSIFSYVRDGDRVDANKIRVMSDSPILLVKLGADTPVVLPEGKTVAAYRAELEANGIEFRYRLISFEDWMKDNDSDLVDRWTGVHPQSIYPVAPQGTFWNEYNPSGAAQEWTLELLSLADGEPVAGHEDYVAEVKNALLTKDLNADGKVNVVSRYAAPAAEQSEAAPEATEAADTTADTSEASEAAPSEAGEATSEAAADEAAA